MKTEYLICSKRDGIYLGQCLGMGFFSMMDCAGQERACTFESPGQAKAHVATWRGMEGQETDPEGFDYVPVVIADEGRATIDEMEAAGLAEFVKPMRDEAIANQIRDAKAEAATATHH